MPAPQLPVGRFSQGWGIGPGFGLWGGARHFRAGLGLFFFWKALESVTILEKSGGFKDHAHKSGDACMYPGGTGNRPKGDASVN